MKNLKPREADDGSDLMEMEFFSSHARWGLQRKKEENERDGKK